MVATMTVAAL